MNMASTSLLFIFPIIFIMGNAESFVSMECKKGPTVQYGQESLLECVLKTAKEVKDLQIRKVIWKKNGVEEFLLNFHEGVTTKQSGYSLAEQSWNNRSRNVSLLISSTTVQHQGAYRCKVSTNVGMAENRISLTVTAKYSAPNVTFNPGKTTPNMYGTLLCKSDGGYPEGQLRWFDVHNKEWMNSAKMEAREMEDGRFELSSRLTLLRGSVFSKYTCAVFNETGSKENEFTFELSTDNAKINEVLGEKPTPVHNVVAPVVVIGSLVIGLLLILIYRWKRKNSQRVPMVSVVEYEKEALEEKKALEDNVV